MPDRIQSIEIKAPLERVWNEIATPNKLCRPMFDSVMDARAMAPGERIRMRSADGKFVFIVGEIKAVEPPADGRAKLVYTFKFTHLPDDYSLVTWELSATPAGTRIKITHNFAAENKTYNMVNKGWPTILGNLKSIMETGKLPLGQRISYMMMSVMSFMTPKAMRAENVRE